MVAQDKRKLKHHHKEKTLFEFMFGYSNSDVEKALRIIQNDKKPTAVLESFVVPLIVTKERKVEIDFKLIDDVFNYIYFELQSLFFLDRKKYTTMQNLNLIEPQDILKALER